MLVDIVEARAVGGHRLYIRFEDGIEGEVELTEVIEFEGVFAPLREPAEVAKVRVDPEIGTICWPTGADLDPDVLYSTLTGEPIEIPEPSWSADSAA